MLCVKIPAEYPLEDKVEIWISDYYNSEGTIPLNILCILLGL